MIIDFKFDSSGDIVLNELSDDIEGISDVEEDIGQSIQVILETKLGEYTLDNNLGMNYTNIATSKGENPLSHYLVQDIESALIEQDERIDTVQVTKNSFNPVTRCMDISVEVTTLESNTFNFESEVNINDI